jgi:putative endonuclease
MDVFQPSKPVLSPRGARGDRAERIACAYLAAHGYELIERNVRFPVGEIDLVAKDGHALCFVEVRSASSTAWGGAAASVTRQKQRRIIRAAQWYLQSCRLPYPDVRFDVVAIDWRDEAAPEVELIRGAFTAD